MLRKYDEKIINLRKKISHLLEDITTADELSLEAFKLSDATKFKEAVARLEKIALQGDAIDNEIIKTFALYGPEAKELRYLVAYLKMTNEIVRTGEGVKKYALKMSEYTSNGCDIEQFKPSILLLHKSENSHQVF